MRLTVSEMMQRIASTTNQEAETPTSGSDEYALWLSFINQAYDQWAEAHDWEELRYDYYPSITGTGAASVSMPSTFRKLAGTPIVYIENTQGVEYEEILPERAKNTESTDRYVTVRGNLGTGYHVIFNPGTLASGASVMIPYFGMPTALVSSGEYSIVPDPQYLVDKAVAYILKSRSDPRFQIEEGHARERLMMMVENANAAKYNSYGGQAPLQTEEQRMGFRMGRD